MSNELKDEWIDALLECKIDEPQKGCTSLYFAPRMIEIWQMSTTLDERPVLQSLLQGKTVLNVPKKIEKYFFQFKKWMEEKLDANKFQYSAEEMWCLVAQLITAGRNKKDLTELLRTFENFAIEYSPTIYHFLPMEVPEDWSDLTLGKIQFGRIDKEKFSYWCNANTPYDLESIDCLDNLCLLYRGNSKKVVDFSKCKRLNFEANSREQTLFSEFFHIYDFIDHVYEYKEMENHFAVIQAYYATSESGIIDLQSSEFHIGSETFLVKNKGPYGFKGIMGRNRIDKTVSTIMHKWDIEILRSFDELKDNLIQPFKCEEMESKKQTFIDLSFRARKHLCNQHYDEALLFYVFSMEALFENMESKISIMEKVISYSSAMLSEGYPEKYKAMKARMASFYKKRNDLVHKGHSPKMSYKELQEMDNILIDIQKYLCKVPKDKKFKQWLLELDAHRAMFEAGINLTIPDEKKIAS